MCTHTEMMNDINRIQDQIKAFKLGYYIKFSIIFSQGTLNHLRCNQNSKVMRRVTWREWTCVQEINILTR